MGCTLAFINRKLLRAAGDMALIGMGGEHMHFPCQVETLGTLGWQFRCCEMEDNVHGMGQSRSYVDPLAASHQKA